jgi:surface antigen
MIVMSRQVLILMILIALFVSGCETTDGGARTKTAIGGLGGAAAGGLLAATAGGGATGIAAGTILGGLIGGLIGDRLDAADRKHMQQTTQHALETAPSGTTVAWQNPDSGHTGVVTPVRTYQKAGGEYCREFQQSVTVGGEEQQAYGTACRQPDGSWKIVN